MKVSREYLSYNVQYSEHIFALITWRIIIIVINVKSASDIQKEPYEALKIISSRNSHFNSSAVVFTNSLTENIKAPLFVKLYGLVWNTERSNGELATTKLNSVFNKFNLVACKIKNVYFLIRVSPAINA